MSCPDAPAAAIVNTAAANSAKARTARSVFKRIVPPYFSFSLLSHLGKRTTTPLLQDARRAWRFQLLSLFQTGPSVYRALLTSVLRRQRKSRLRSRAVEELAGNIRADRRPMFESMSRAPAHKPNIFHRWMPVDQKIPVRTVFVLAHTRFDNRRILQCRESPRHVLSHHLRHLRRNNPRLRVRINSLPMLVKGNLQSSSFDVRHSINQVFLKQPSRQRRCRKPRIARGNPKEKHFLSRREYPRLKNVRKNFSKPRPARKNKIPRRDFFAATCFYFVNAAGSRWPEDLSAAIPRSQPNRIFRHGSHRPPRQQHAAIRLQDSALDLFQSDLRVSSFERLAIQFLERNSTTPQRLLRVLQARVIPVRHPKNARFKKKGILRGLKKLLPLRERLLRPSRVQLIRAVAHSNDPRFAPRTRPRMRRTVGFHQRHSLASLRQMPRRPRPKHSRPDHRNVVSSLSAHGWSILSQPGPQRTSGSISGSVSRPAYAAVKAGRICDDFRITHTVLIRFAFSFSSVL